MSEFDTGAAPAAAEPSAASNEQVVQTPNPIRTDPQPAPKEPAKAEEKPSARDAIAKAREKVKEAEKTDAANKPVKSDPAKAEPTKTNAKEPEKATPKRIDGETETRAAGTSRRTAAEKHNSSNRRPARSNEGQQPAKPRYEAPKRFSSDVAASADWAKTPESVQAAVHRVQREMEDGITKHKTSRTIDTRASESSMKSRRATATS